MTTTHHLRPERDVSARPEPGPDAADDTRRPAAPGTKPTAPATKDDAPAKLSLTQVLASALAAVSTTVLLSYFGTAGTIIGAGIASALTVVANYVYTRSIQKTREQLVPVVGKVVQVTTGTGAARDRTTTTTVTTAVANVPRGSATVDDDADGAEGAGDADGTDAEEAQPDAPATDTPTNRWLRLVDRYGRGPVLTVTALALFVVVMGAVLVVELTIGKPIADAVRGVEGSGTTISRDRSVGTETPVTPAPTVPAPDPSGVPTQDPVPAPSTTPTEEPTTAPTEEPGVEPTPDPTTDPTMPEPDPSTTPEPGTGTGTGEETGEGAPVPGTGPGEGATAEQTPAPVPPATS
ncbi:hypothetical protein GJV82_00370 [Cellulosimicrobium sp. BIT-GX5]|uniref:Uncharacterized protein n=1 Tax=Cellulosimicrobium composti TaxID=2672572 RepID=A0A6N7ZDG0_9MICO|nr:hypothetical protein [Cellulosimicrobium composti]MTG87421.1 hypothetical protein [Cellulosimicrobium composti]